MIKVGGWEQLEPVGKDGQSKEFLVRSPRQDSERRDVTEEVLRSSPWTAALDEQELSERIDRLATPLWKCAGPHKVSEPGALKMFKILESSPEAEEALLNRINKDAMNVRAAPVQNGSRLSIFSSFSPMALS